MTVRAFIPSFAGRVEAAAARLSPGAPLAAWTEPGADQDLIALVAYTAILSGHLAGGLVEQNATNYGVESPLAPPVTLLTVTADLRGPGPRLAAARALWAPFVAYRALDATAADEDDVTVETAVLPIAIIVAGAVVGVTIALGGAAVAAYTVSHASQLINNVLSRRADAKALQATQTAALEAVSTHVAREKQAGKPLTLDEATAKLLDGLQRQSQTIAERRYEVDSGPFDGKSAASWYLTPVALVSGGALAAAAVVLFLRK